MQRNSKSSIVTAFLIAIFAVIGVNAGGPLFMWNAEQRIPYRYDVTNPVPVYTDLGPFEIIPPQYTPITNEFADGIMQFALDQWNDVETSSFQAQIVGDFGTLGLPDITSLNAGSVIGPDNGGGIHVIYDADGLIIRDFFGAGSTVLGIASPEWADESTGVLTESWLVINAQRRHVNDQQLENYAGVFTHEFGHSINLAHSQVNGAIAFYNNARGPANCTTYPYDPNAVRVNDIETMYPFINTTPGQSGIIQSTVDRTDDKKALSDIYPAPGYPASHGSIKGKIVRSNGRTGITGINVIARNIDNPFADAVSAMSGDWVRVPSGDDGTFELTGLTPGASYALYTDGIVQGGFPTAQPLFIPAPEEYYNGANESNNALTDNRCAAEPILVQAGGPIEADIELNGIKGSPRFIPLAPGTIPTSVSTDGKVIGGSVSNGPVFRWTEEEGFEIVGDGPAGQATMSRNGKYFADQTPNAAGQPVSSRLEYGSGEWQQLPALSFEPPAITGCSGQVSSSWGVANTGAVTGMSWVDVNGPASGGCVAKPFVWTPETGSSALPMPENGRSGRANNMSADGSTVVGWYDQTTNSNRQGAIWKNGQLIQLYTTSFPVGEAYNTTPDGSVVVGQDAGPAGSTPRQSWRWTSEGGLELLGRLYPYGTTGATAISDDGKIIAGLGGSTSRFPSDISARKPFLWTSQLGMIDFEQFLIGQGTFTEGFFLNTAVSMSGDGRTWSGVGFGRLGATGYVIKMDKIAVCHAPPGNPSKAKSISIPFGADSMDSHLRHGDTLGVCSGDYEY